MKGTVAAALVLLLTLAGCASGGTTLLEPEIVVRQMPDNFELLAFPGSIAIRYQVTIGNRSAETIALERFELRSNGPGPYSVREKLSSVNVTIPAGELVTFDFVVDAISRGDDRIMREPVTLSGTAYFRSHYAPFSRSFIQIIRGVSRDAREN